MGFDASSVVQMSVMLAGSGGLDNLVFVPEPASTSMLLLGALALVCRRRR